MLTQNLLTQNLFYTAGLIECQNTPQQCIRFSEDIIEAKVGIQWKIYRLSGQDQDYLLLSPLVLFTQRFFIGIFNNYCLWIFHVNSILSAMCACLIVINAFSLLFLVQCLKCKNNSNTFDPLMDIMLDVKVRAHFCIMIIVQNAYFLSFRLQYIWLI